jgi:hypothetical protein
MPFILQTKSCPENLFFFSLSLDEISELKPLCCRQFDSFASHEFKCLKINTHLIIHLLVFIRRMLGYHLRTGPKRFLGALRISNIPGHLSAHPMLHNHFS